MECCIKLARAGDRQAVAAVVQALHPRLERMAKYYGRCTGEDPDDLLQEAWIGLLESLPRLDLQIGSPEQYLIQRAKWRLLDFARRSRVRRTLPLEDTILDALVAPGGNAGAVFVEDFARNLTATQRQILQYLLAGCTWREAGDALGCTSANVAYHVRQIRRSYERWSQCDTLPL